MKQGPERPIDEPRVGLMIGKKLPHASRSVFRAVSHANRAVRQLLSLIRERVRLEIVDHL